MNTDVITSVETFLQELLGALAAPDAPARGRPRILPSVCLWAALLVCILRQQVGQSALWRLLRQTGLWAYPRFPISDQAVYKRLAQAGTQPLETLFTQLNAALAQRIPATGLAELAPFAAQVVAVDETTLDPVTRFLPALTDAPAQRLPGKLTAVFDLRRQQFASVTHQDDPQQNEKVAARQAVAPLAPGTLILADLGYFGFAWFDDLTEQGYHWLSRLRAKTSYTVIHSFYQHGETFDGLVWLGAYRRDHAQYAVRLVQYRHGATLHQYITNVCDPQVFPLPQIAQVYARRWDIELAFKLIKRELHLHLWWSSKQTIILQHVWGVLIIAQILLALRQQIAAAAEVDPQEVSLPLLVRYVPQYVAEGRDPIAAWVDHGRDARFIRPSRRLLPQTPTLPADAYHAPPPDLVVTRPPRYAHKN